MKVIDIRSDTVSLPTNQMRQAMAAAEVGDDVYQDDPTVNQLEKEAAERVGKAAALFVSSGTQGNLLGIWSQTKRGDEIITGARNHIISHEVGGIAQICQCMTRLIDHADDRIYPEDIRRAVRNDDIHEPPTALVSLENALSNGTVVPLDIMREDYQTAHQLGLKVHLDGARIFNAATVLGVDVRDAADCCDTVMFCLSKGLCAPVGSILAGPQHVIDRARKLRKMIGGGLRQSGILAAAGLIALNEMPMRLHEDHEHARQLAALLEKIPGVHIKHDQLDINIVFFTLDWKLTSDQIVDGLAEAGIKANGADHGVYRFVTHQGVSAEDIQKTAQVMRQLGGQT